MTAKLVIRLLLLLTISAPAGGRRAAPRAPPTEQGPATTEGSRGRGSRKAWRALALLLAAGEHPGEAGEASAYVHQQPASRRGRPQLYSQPPWERPPGKNLLGRVREEYNTDYYRDEEEDFIRRNSPDPYKDFIDRRNAQRPDRRDEEQQPNLLQKIRRELLRNVERATAWMGPDSGEEVRDFEDPRQRAPPMQMASRSERRPATAQPPPGQRGRAQAPLGRGPLPGPVREQPPLGREPARLARYDPGRPGQRRVSTQPGTFAGKAISRMMPRQVAYPSSSAAVRSFTDGDVKLASGELSGRVGASGEVLQPQSRRPPSPRRDFPPSSAAERTFWDSRNGEMQPLPQRRIRRNRGPGVASDQQRWEPPDRDTRSITRYQRKAGGTSDQQRWGQGWSDGGGEDAYAYDDEDMYFDERSQPSQRRQRNRGVSSDQAQWEPSWEKGRERGEYYDPLQGERIKRRGYYDNSPNY